MRPPDTLPPLAATHRRGTGGSLAALLAGAVAIGFAPIFVRLSEVGPSATAFWRVFLALPALGLWAFLTPARQQDRAEVAPKPGAWRGLALVGFFFAGDLAVWHWSIHFTSVANATLEANLASVGVVLIGWLAFGQRVSRRFLLAMAVALAGTALLVGKNVRLSPETLRGDALGVLTAGFYAGYLLSVRAARTQGGWSTAPIMAASGAVTAAILLPVAALSGERLLPGTAHGWWVLLGLAMISHVGGQSLIAYALAKLPASFASVGLLVQPPTAALAAWALLGESLAPGQLAGGVLLLAGILLARRESAG